MTHSRLFQLTIAGLIFSASGCASAGPSPSPDALADTDPLQSFHVTPRRCTIAPGQQVESPSRHSCQPTSLWWSSVGEALSGAATAVRNVKP